MSSAFASTSQRAASSQRPNSARTIASGASRLIALPRRAPASRCSRAAENSGEVTVSVRGVARGRRRAQLGDEPRRAGRQHRDAVAEVERLLDVVGDEHHRARLGGERGCEPLLHLAARDRVEAAERLVEQQHGLAGEQRPQEGDALAHPAGELARPRRLETGEAEALEQRRRGAARLGAAEAMVSERQRRVVERGQPGEQQIALRHVGAALEALLGGALADHRDLVPRWAAAGRRSARAASTCRTPRGRSRRRPRVAASVRSRRSITSSSP